MGSELWILLRCKKKKKNQIKMEENDSQGRMNGDDRDRCADVSVPAGDNVWDEEDRKVRGQLGNAASTRSPFKSGWDGGMRVG